MKGSRAAGKCGRQLFAALAKRSGGPVGQLVEIFPSERRPAILRGVL